MMQNHLEISSKNPILDPKHAKLVQNSYGKFTESLRKVLRKVYGVRPLKARVPQASFYPKLRDILSRARFQMVPPGDTVERASRDQSISMGVVPVYWGWYKNTYHALPWSDIIN